MNKERSTDMRIERFLAQHRDFTAGLNGAGQLLQARRSHAIGQFEGMGFPTLRDEEWRYTNILPATETAYLPPYSTGNVPADIHLDGILAGYAGGPLLVFVNGLFSESLSRPGELAPGLVVEDLQAAIAAGREGVESIDSLRGEDESAFAALNTAFMQHGAYIHVPRNLSVEHPVHCLFLALPSEGCIQAHPRLFVRAESGSHLQLIEQYSGNHQGPYLTNALIEVQLHENARVDHYRLQLEGAKSFHFSTALAVLGRDARYDNHYFSLGAGMVRNDVRTVLDGEGAHCALNGLYMPRDHQHMDTHTLIDHAKPHCTSEELYKGIVDDHGRGVFCGRIIVRQDAQKTDAQQSNKNLLLSDHAMVDTKPQLEIYADDVRCTHGATIGQIDETAMFYLRSRGISVNKAKDVLTYAFASEAVRKVADEPLRNWLDGHIHSLLEESWQKG